MGFGLGLGFGLGFGFGLEEHPEHPDLVPVATLRSVPALHLDE